MAFRHLCQNLADFFVEWEMLQRKVAEEPKTHTLMVSNFFPKIVPFMR
jgi:hypothetical protein